ncbi:UDP-glycosyltransferase UGT5-like isoform X2 [Anthonomus grandis grandis]|uniref:UDP-glycosyltransferase UGT5-like isoform X2 n=1 Tax=Anthonomus grandis grandis TaxID=2921223 RepID=UPI00216635B5|nr:UDP-glycosyltransferase UGT5-like isoform X2 [Anthonomus grandis grandis]
MMLLKVISLCLLLVYNVNSYKILGVFPIAAVSHQILATKLMETLAEAGHEVTLVSPYPVKNVAKHWKYRNIVLDGIAEEFEDFLKNFNFYGGDNTNPITRIRQVFKMITDMTNNTLSHPKMIELVKSNEQFDALIVEQFNQDGLKAYASIFNCHQIIFSSTGPNSWINPTVGNPQPVSNVPSSFSGNFSRELSFWDRSKNLASNLFEYFIMTFILHPIQDSLVQQICSDCPSVSELHTNASLVLLNSHTSIHHAVPLVPNMAEIGGYFIDPSKPLPKDLQEFMDNAKDGVIYFSMGSNLKSKDLPEATKNGIIKVLGKLKQRVIWKFEEDLPNKPANVLIQKWCPQADILAHPNVKLFITHSGFLSTIETIYHGVPVLAIPVFADQFMNAKKAVAYGYGLKLAYNDPNFSEEALSALLDELLTNPKYHETAKFRSKLYHDRLATPIETLNYWVNYTLRYKGAKHLQVAGVQLPLHQYLLLDVVGFMVAGLVFSLWIVLVLFKRVRMIVKTGSKQKTQ